MTNKTSALLQTWLILWSGVYYRGPPVTWSAVLYPSSESSISSILSIRSFGVYLWNHYVFFDYVDRLFDMTFRVLLSSIVNMLGYISTFVNASSLVVSRCCTIWSAVALRQRLVLTVDGCRHSVQLCAGMQNCKCFDLARPHSIAAMISLAYTRPGPSFALHKNVFSQFMQGHSCWRLCR